MAMESYDSERVKQLMAALGELLQSTKRSVEHLCEEHILASLQASKQRRPAGLSAFRMPSASQKGFQPPPMADDVVKKADEAPYTSTSAPSGKAAPAIDRTLSEPELERATGFFLKDVKKTVDTWCSRYQLLAGGKVSLNAMPQPLHSNMQVMDQLGFDANQEFCGSGELDPSHVRDNERPHTCAQNEKVVRENIVKQVVAGHKKSPISSHTYQNKAPASGSSPQGMIGSTETAQNVELSQQGEVGMKEPTPSESEFKENRKMNTNHACAMETQDFTIREELDGDVEKAPANEGVTEEEIVREGAIVKFNSPDELEKKPTDNVKSPAATDELTIRHYQYKVEVVESPDWLPKGWITELKTRSTGGSAGCKDKYYFDPVSKRRCRSQKEVFCLIETGKLGRYKRRHKAQPAKKLPGIDLEKEVSNSCEMRTTSKQGVSGTKTISFSDPYSQDNAPSPLAAYPGAGHRGVVGGTFLPYRPGQTSEFLYESMVNLARSGMDQYRFMDPSSSKPTGDRNSDSRSWFWGNAEGLTRPIFNMDKSEKGVGGQGFGRGRRGTAGALKHARKSSKRSAS